MSDHEGADNSPGCFMFFGILTLPAAVAGYALANNYVETTYKHVAVPANVLANINTLKVILEILPVLGIFVFFVGIYLFIQGHIGGGH